jgi:hypothetical protein
MDTSNNTNAIDLLRELDERQEQVLSELDELNSRVEKVLELYLGSRQSLPHAMQSEQTLHERAA